MDAADRIAAAARKPERLALGLMSGMSMDGLDLALVRIRGRTLPRSVDLLAAETVPYEPVLRARLRAAVAEGTVRNVCLLDFELAERWAREVLAFLGRQGVDPRQVDVLGSHGQTLDHVSGGREGRGATLQVGNGCVLAERTGIVTVSDFRSRDVAAEGEGAPLVPLADWLLFARAGEVTACHNLGSIANVTVVTERREDVLAFDTGPANALIDGFARMTAAPDGIDLDGTVSAEGRLLPDVLAYLLVRSGGFLLLPPPRSAGFDDFGPALAEAVHHNFPDVAAVDLVRTAVEFTARTIADAYSRHVQPRFPTLRVVRFSGGGTRNATLMSRIAALLDPLGLSVEAMEDLLSKSKEAVAFALLADETLAGSPGNLRGATGARREVILGRIAV